MALCTPCLLIAVDCRLAFKHLFLLLAVCNPCHPFPLSYSNFMHEVDNSECMGNNDCMYGLHVAAQGRHQHIQPKQFSEFLTFTQLAKLLAQVAGHGLWIVHSNQCRFMIVCREGHPQWGTAVANTDSAFQPCLAHQRNSPSANFCSQSGSAPIFDSCRAEGYTRMPILTGSPGGRTTLRDLLRRQEVPSGTAYC